MNKKENLSENYYNGLAQKLLIMEEVEEAKKKRFPQHDVLITGHTHVINISPAPDAYLENEIDKSERK